MLITKNRGLWLLLSGFCFNPAYAEAVFLQSGPAYSLGKAAHGQHLLSYSSNPAAPLLFKEDFDERENFMFLSNLSFGEGYSSVENLSATLVDLSNDLQTEDLSLAEAEAVIEEYEDFLVEAGNKGYRRRSSGMYLPATPVYFSLSDTSVFSLELSFAEQGNVSVLDDEITYNELQEGLETNSSLYIKGGAQHELGLGYSVLLGEGNGSRWLGGFKARWIQLELGKEVIGLTEDSIIARDLETTLEREYGQETASDIQLGLDFGLIYETASMRLGASLKNANSPTFSYNILGENCESLEGAEQDRCLLSVHFQDEIALAEEHTLNPYVQLEGTWLSDDKRLVISGSYDTEAVNDLTGAKIQWANLGLSYLTASKDWGVRFGYRSNEVKNGLDFGSFGLSLYEFLHFDYTRTFDTTLVDGETTPRAEAYSIGVSALF